jgi:hypothetical protein
MAADFKEQTEVIRNREVAGDATSQRLSALLASIDAVATGRHTQFGDRLRCAICLGDETMNGRICPHKARTWERLRERAALEAVFIARNRMPLCETEDNKANRLVINHLMLRHFEEVGMRPSHIQHTLIVATQAYWVLTRGEASLRRRFDAAAAVVIGKAEATGTRV